MFAPSNLVPIILETHEAPILKVGIHLRKLRLISLHSTTLVKVCLSLETLS
jgi:hypothetical protein